MFSQKEGRKPKKRAGTSPNRRYLGKGHKRKRFAFWIFWPEKAKKYRFHLAESEQGNFGPGLRFWSLTNSKGRPNTPSIEAPLFICFALKNEGQGCGAPAARRFCCKCKEERRVGCGRVKHAPALLDADRPGRSQSPLGSARLRRPGTLGG